MNLFEQGAVALAAAIKAGKLSRLRCCRHMSRGSRRSMRG